MNSVSNAKKSRVKKTAKRRELSDKRSEITIKDVEQMAIETDKGYVYTCVQICLNFVENIFFN